MTLVSTKRIAIVDLLAAQAVAGREAAMLCPDVQDRLVLLPPEPIEVRIVRNQAGEVAAHEGGHRTVALGGADSHEVIEPLIEGNRDIPHRFTVSQFHSDGKL